MTHLRPYLVFCWKKREKELFQSKKKKDCLVEFHQGLVLSTHVKITSVSPVDLAATVVLVLVAICTLRLQVHRQRVRLMQEC